MQRNFVAACAGIGAELLKHRMNGLPWQAVLVRKPPGLACIIATRDICSPDLWLNEANHNDNASSISHRFPST